MGTVYQIQPDPDKNCTSNSHWLPLIILPGEVIVTSSPFWWWRLLSIYWTNSAVVS